MLEHDQPDHKGLFPASKLRISKKLRLQFGYCEYKMKALLIKMGFCDAFVWSLNTNEVREVAAMANFKSKQNSREKLLDGSTYIGARGGGQRGGRTSQGSLKLTLGRTRLMGPSGGDVTPLDL